MSRIRAMTIVAAVLAGLFVSGCGSMSASGLAMKGAMWVGKELIKKELRDRESRRNAERPPQRPQQGG